MEGACGSVGKSVGFGHVPCEMTFRFEPQSTREIYHYECAILCIKFPHRVQIGTCWRTE